MKQDVRIAIDRGGTFTDVYYKISGWREQEGIFKLLSVNPKLYDDAPTEGIRRVLCYASGEEIPRKVPLDLTRVSSIRMGTTVATNALLERKGEKTAFIITEGFRNLVEIGNQARPDLFDLTVSRPSPLYQRVIEAKERVVLENQFSKTAGIVQGITGEFLRVEKKLDEEALYQDLKELYNEGFRSISVSLMHSYTYPLHEEVVEKIAKRIGFTDISLSSKLTPMVKIVPRAVSAIIDAYLSSTLRYYLDSFKKNFYNVKPNTIQFMKSDGGLVDIDNFTAISAIMSGPAAGTVGFAKTSSLHADDKTPAIGFDMGGTSTDVSRYDGKFEHIYEANIFGLYIQSPQLDIQTVAAGGGSRLFWRNQLFSVGPESAGAFPGPACYLNGGPLTVTDANVLLGRIIPDFFPKIFGPKENESMNKDIVIEKFSELRDIINIDIEKEKTIEEIAMGFIQVANETMCRPIRKLTESRGLDLSAHHLAVFGGAGGQHACAIASLLNIEKIIIHKYSSVLSAYGLALAHVTHEEQMPCLSVLDEDNLPLIQSKFDVLDKKAVSFLENEGYLESQISTELFANLRYEGNDTTMMIAKPKDSWDFKTLFEESYKNQFGFSLIDRKIMVEDIRIRAIARASNQSEVDTVFASETENENTVFIRDNKPTMYTPVYFAEVGKVNCHVYQLSSLPVHSLITGPAVIVDTTQTLLIEPSFTAKIFARHVLLEKTKSTLVVKKNVDLDPITMTIFANRFMSISEQMGQVLQKTAVSVNVKERLDYSCALFSPDGGLVANAPHVPAMLGSMQTAVKWQHNYWKGKLVPGDVLLSNHPIAGGVHLPDLTVVTPVFDNNKDIIFYCAARGHMVDVGGITPGSMPSNSKAIYEEGAAIKTFKVVKAGTFDEKGLTQLLFDEPAKYPDCSGSRTLRDNISDVKAMLSACHRGRSMVEKLVVEYGLDIVQRSMYGIQAAAEKAVRDVLKAFSVQNSQKPLKAIDYMDDGTPLQLEVKIDPETGDAVFDFEGTGPEVYGNWNAPIAITYSSVIYCLRSIINQDIPLNEGCLKPIEIRIPPSCFLNPSETAAVVGGNVLTSQRITDVILKAFSICAASQGCMNNLTFGYDGENGEEGFAMYETIAGGAGAGPTWNGTSGVHTHMTNTRITDPEVVERRAPVILRRFCLRENSGGKGEYHGGDGVIRHFEFRRSMHCSILSERRSRAPYGMNGGEDGAMGVNTWIDCSNPDFPRYVNLGGKNHVLMGKGDHIVIETPGGGGYGAVSI
ncbi:5-oxoprolinase (ATP-hydrolizing) [Schizosaccharomyces pombe]|uniref:Uncharacterized protein C11D3.14c n=1 Tax=Schizosaccharomyces pombe (strain 972 / ATCC 24843) TaxID=284812 RepID=YAOE_SCHPO|nr:putative oxoprolinase [Schizosaccharomyces pombe]Q10093.1 RecName: Full=Uncharacterized protein C11D3.14c [Schizosaccharomyces pombe 972h-]CAA92315.1 oxoprolinase (predicted) [Schizosaccharomyces pombe]|eukprot:NP_592809.1 putative oxoprolinase [Schizosaccharomyces pombe]